ncbi:MAG: hypothetical protein AAB290_00120 [Candidatus Eisenbacteria bacterium]
MYAGHLGTVIAGGVVGGAICLAGSAFAVVGLLGLRRLMGVLARTASRDDDPGATAVPPAHPGGGAPEDGTPIA